MSQIDIDSTPCMPESFSPEVSAEEEKLVESSRSSCVDQEDAFLMTQNVNEAAANQVIEELLNGPNGTHFLERIFAIPLVAAGVSSYETLKKGKLSGMAVNAVETTMATLSKPVIKRLEPYHTDLDTFGCRQLDKLENLCPQIFKETPHALLDKFISVLTIRIEALQSASNEVRHLVSKSLFDENLLRNATQELKNVIEKMVQTLGSYGISLSDKVTVLFNQLDARYKAKERTEQARESLIAHGKDLMQISEYFLVILRKLQRKINENWVKFTAVPIVSNNLESEEIKTK